MDLMRSSTVRRLLARLGIRPIPISLHYEVTGRCNLSCAYCDRRSSLRAEMTRSQIFKALEEFLDLGLAHVHLDGGEPLLHAHIDEIVDWLSQRGISLSMHSNGILVRGKLGTVRKLSRLGVSLDGPRANHDGLRGEGSFDAAVEGSKAARDAGVHVEFICTVSRHNADAVDELVALAERIAIPVAFRPAINSLNRDPLREGSGWKLETSALRAAFVQVERLKRGGRPILNDWQTLWRLRDCPEESRRTCGAGHRVVTLDPEGMLFPCGAAGRGDRTNSVPRLGAAATLSNLSLTRYGRCWSARLVEGESAAYPGFSQKFLPLAVPRPI